MVIRGWGEGRGGVDLLCGQAGLGEEPVWQSGQFVRLSHGEK